MAWRKILRKSLLRLYFLCLSFLWKIRFQCSFGFVQTQNNVALEVFLTSRFNPFWPKLFNGSARNYAILEPLRSKKFVCSRWLRGTNFQGSTATIIFLNVLELTFIEISRILFWSKFLKQFLGKFLS